MQMTWFCVSSSKKTLRQWWDVLLRCVGENIFKKINADESKEIVLNGEEGLECEICVDGIRLEDVSERKYIGCFWMNHVQIM